MAKQKHYAIMTMQKISSKASYNGRSSHNDRSIPCPDADMSLSKNNICLKQSPYKNYDDFIEKKKAEIKEANIKNNTKHRFLREKFDKKNKEYSIGGIGAELVITHSPNAMSEEESIKYLRDSFEFFKDHFKPCEIDDAYIHLDEKTPHLHLKLFYFDNERKKFIQKEMSQEDIKGNRRTNVNHIRYEFLNYLKAKGGAGAKMLRQDGKVVKKGTHTQAKKEVGDLKEQIKKLKTELDFTNKSKASFAEENKKLIIERLNLKEKIQELEKNKSTSTEENKEVGELKKIVNILSKSKKDLESLVENLGLENEELKTENNELKNKLDLIEIKREDVFSNLVSSSKKLVQNSQTENKKEVENTKEDVEEFEKNRVVRKKR